MKFSVTFGTTRWDVQAKQTASGWKATLVRCENGERWGGYKLQADDYLTLLGMVADLCLTA